MNAARLAVGILLLVACVLWDVGSFALIAGVGLSGIAVFIGNIVGIVAAVMLLVCVKKQGASSIDWRFDFVAGLLLLASSIVLTIASIAFIPLILGFIYSPWQGALLVLSILDLGGALTFLVAAVLIIRFSKKSGLRPINLPRAEGVAFGLLFLISSILGALGYAASLSGTSGFVGLALVGLVATVLQVSGMIVYLYPYAKWNP